MTRCYPTLEASLIVLVLALSGCSRCGLNLDQEDDSSDSDRNTPLPGFVIGQVASRPESSSSNSIDGIDPGDVGHRFRRAILALPDFVDEGGPGPVIDFVLSWSVGLGSSDPPPLGDQNLSDCDAPPTDEYVVLVLSAVGEDITDPRYQFEVHGLYRNRLCQGDTPLHAAERLIHRRVDDIVNEIGDAAAPRCADDQELLNLLNQSSEDRALHSIREIHRRSLSSAGPTLLSLLEAEDREVVIGSVLALGRIRYAEAVSPLIDLVSRERPELVVQVLETLGQIGTTPAFQYLETVATAHDNEAVRQLASDVLERAGE